MVNALAVLLFSSLTCVGLLALWAATSSQHWFWRTMLFLGIMSLLLLIPAYEPFVAFVIQGAVIAAGVQLANWWRNRDVKAERTGARFGLRSILLAMVPLAMLTAVVARLPELTFRAWQSVVLIGLCAGAATLIGLWIVRGPYVRWWLRVLFGLTLAGVISLMLFAGDWFIASTHRFWSWPPLEDDGTGWWTAGFHDDHREPAWIAIVYLLVGCVTLVQWLLSAAIAPRPEFGKQTATAKRTISIAILILIGIVLFSPTVGTYYNLMNPLPIPEPNLPVPNGYDDFLAGVNLLPSNMIVNGMNFDSDTASPGQLRAAVSEMQPAIERVRTGLSKSIWGQLDYNSDDLGMDDIMLFRSIARGMSASSILARKEKTYSQASALSMDLIEFGEGIGRGRLLVDSLVGIACMGIGCHDLFQLRDEVTVEQCVNIASRLAEIESNLESIEDVLYRDRVWTQHAMGWHAHLMQYLEAFSGKVLWSSDSFYDSDRRNRAILRLLQLEFALRARKAEHGEWPESLAELVPAIIPTVPVDPFSPDGKPLQYVRTDEGYVLYSVGQNEIDEGGKIPDDDGSGWHDPLTGDLRLDIHFAPDPPSNAGTVGDSEDPSEEQNSPFDE